MTAATSPRVFIDGEFHRAAQAEPVLEAATGEPIGDGASGTAVRSCGRSAYMLSSSSRPQTPEPTRSAK